MVNLYSFHLHTIYSIGLPFSSLVLLKKGDKYISFHSYPLLCNTFFALCFADKCASLIDCLMLSTLTFMFLHASVRWCCKVDTVFMISDALWITKLLPGLGLVLWYGVAGCSTLAIMSLF